MKNIVKHLLLCLPFCFSIAFAKNPIVCESEFALCTTAQCTPVPGDDNLSLCHCTIQKGYSAGFEECEAPKKNDEGYTVVKSRYYPVKSYISCANNRPWANCLDMTCIVDAKDPTKAVCSCPLVKNEGEYMVVTDTCQAVNCDQNIYSSVLVTNDMSALLKEGRKTNSIKNADKLPSAIPYDCNVVKQERPVTK